MWRHVCRSYILWALKYIGIIRIQVARWKDSLKEKKITYRWFYCRIWDVHCTCKLTSAKDERMESVISEKKEGKSGKSESRLFAPFRSHVDPLCLSGRGPFYDRARNAAVTVASSPSERDRDGSYSVFQTDCAHCARRRDASDLAVASSTRRFPPRPVAYLGRAVARSTHPWPWNSRRRWSTGEVVDTGG
jgi:hypothetical protein